MFKMYGDYKFDPEKDCFVNTENGMEMDLYQSGDYYIHFKNDQGYDKEYRYSSNLSAEEFEKEIELAIAIVNTELYREEKYDTQLEMLRKNTKNNFPKIKITKGKEKVFDDPTVKSIEPPFSKKPSAVSKETIEKCLNKSNAAEVSFLERRVADLESRVAILEDSVEDLEEWRHK